MSQPHLNIFTSKYFYIKNVILFFVQRDIALIYTVGYSKPQHLAVVPQGLVYCLTTGRISPAWQETIVQLPY